MFVLVVAKMLAGLAAFMHAIATRDARTHLEQEGKAEQDDEAFEHPRIIPAEER